MNYGNLLLHCVCTFFLFGIYFVNVSRCSSITFTVHIEEEKPEDSFVVNVAELFKADKLKLSKKKFEFTLLSQKLKTPGSQPRETHNSWVKLDSETGLLKTSRKIDRDSECSGITHCVVHIQVFMLPQTSFTFLDLDLVIDDVNDNAPKFQDAVIDIKINEAWQIGEVYNLDPFQAKDQDAGNNSEIFYELSANSYFSLQQTEGKGGLQHLELVLDEKLDREQESTISMILTAVDNGSPRMRSELDLKVTVVDANDNAPTFDQEEYRITLLENSSPGLAVDTVTARDEDSGALGEVRYSISTRNTNLAQGLFVIDSRSGELHLGEKVDRAKHNGIRVLIEARDSDPINQKIGEAWLIVNVEDLNDNAPEISVLYILHATENTVYIPESAQKETFILRVSATDADSGDNGRIRLSMETTTPCDKTSDGDSDAQKTFVLHPDGLVATVRPLDRESCDEYIVVISACDHGNPAKCSSRAIKVKVLDENEFAPKFRASTQRVTIPEDSTTGSRITTVRAYDGDSEGGSAVVINRQNEVVASKNGVVQYLITSGGRGPFSLNQKTGVLYLQRKLDREEQDEWKITVTALDGALPSALESSCTVIITVSDVNDNAPRFLSPSVNDSLIYASTISDEVITKLVATDKDDGKNAEIHFKLFSEEKESVNSTRRILVHGSQNVSSSSFVLNPTTGELRLNFSRRNFSSILGMHTVKIQAYDMGTPRQCSNVTIRIQVSNSPIVYRTPGDLTAAGQLSLLLVATIGSAFIFSLIILGLVIFVKCRRAKKESKSYSLPKDDADGDFIEKNDVIDVLSVGMEPVDVIPESDCADESKGTVATGLTDDGTALTSRYDSVSKFTHEDMGYLSVARNVNPASPSHSDGDSGRGDSDSGGVTCRNQKREFSAIDSGLGANCTEQCVELGHSDSCWMPLIKNHPCVAPLNRPLHRISESNASRHPSAPKNRQPSRAVNNDMRSYRSPSRASALDENFAYMKRTRSISNFSGYDMNYPAHSRCMSPNYGQFQNRNDISPSYVGLGPRPPNRPAPSCLVLPRASVASTSNLLLENEKHTPSSSATNFLINYHQGNKKINVETAHKSLNPHCQTSTSTPHMLAINAPCHNAPISDQFVGGSVSPHFFNGPPQSIPRQNLPEGIVMASTSMIV